MVRTSPRSEVVSHELRYGPPLYSSASLSLSPSSQQPPPSREEAARQRRESDRRRRELLFAQRKERDALRFQHLRDKLEPASTELASSTAHAVSEFTFPDCEATADAASGSDDPLKPAFIPVDNAVATGASSPRVASQPPAAEQMYRSVAEKSSDDKNELCKAERKLHASVSVESSASASCVSTAEDSTVCDTCGGLVACRGSGADRSVGAWNEYRSACKVLLVGLGADEQLGGYGRHRVVHNAAYSAALNQSERAADGDVSSPSSPDASASTHDVAAAAAEVALRTELLKDTARLWRRNLGRDDRCVSDHGREARHPYVRTSWLMLHTVLVDRLYFTNNFIYIVDSFLVLFLLAQVFGRARSRTAQALALGIHLRLKAAGGRVRRQASAATHRCTAWPREGGHAAEESHAIWHSHCKQGRCVCLIYYIHFHSLHSELSMPSICPSSSLARFLVSALTVSGTVALDSTIRLDEIVNQRALRPLDAAPGGRARVSDKVDKKTVKRIEREMAARNV